MTLDLLDKAQIPSLRRLAATDRAALSAALKELGLSKLGARQQAIQELLELASVQLSPGLLALEAALAAPAPPPPAAPPAPLPAPPPPAPPASSAAITLEEAEAAAEARLESLDAALSPAAESAAASDAARDAPSARRLETFYEHAGVDRSFADVAELTRLAAMVAADRPAALRELKALGLGTLPRCQAVANALSRWGLREGLRPPAKVVPLIVCVECGLGNRLRCFLSHVLVGRQVEKSRKVALVWNADAQCNGDFEECFEVWPGLVVARSVEEAR